MSGLVDELVDRVVSEWIGRWVGGSVRLMKILYFMCITLWGTKHKLYKTEMVHDETIGGTRRFRPRAFVFCSSEPRGTREKLKFC